MGRRATAGATAFACIAAAGLAAGNARAAAGWSATATHAISGSGIADTGALAPSTPMTIEVAMSLRNTTALNQDIAAGDTMSVDAFKSQFGPTALQLRAVKSYLTSSGLTPTAVTPNNLLITATGPASAVERAFNTRIETVTAGSASGYANVTPAQVPSGFASTVAAVLGLNDVFSMSLGSLHAAQPASSCTVQGVGYLCDYNPQGFQHAYDATGTPTGAKTTEAIFAEGDLTQVIKDLRTEETANKLPKVPVTIDHTGIASSDTSGADEWDLDTQYSTGMAQTVKDLRIYDATSLTDSDLALSFADFAGQDKAKAGSASFGECEALAFLDGSMVADDESFAEAAVQGQTVFASSGDTGGFCTVAPTNGVPAGIPDVEYPAASPYVVAVGGTTLLTNADGSYDEELAWLAGGGGPSYFELAPGWQAGDGVVGTIGSLTGLRTLPDVSMDADPNSGANVYVNGTPETVGGTSLASPLSLGVWDRLESGHGNGLGFASPKLYALNGSAAFHDVTLGDNGPYPATPGYDLATGIGSFDVAQAESLIK
ncbi:MAG TPA: S53 family serine peptidase [Solirubrobacteraceae bacterium]|nr:S53 family serine peptidase [Solirubrobacteraceae bacterium]